MLRRVTYCFAIVALLALGARWLELYLGNKPRLLASAVERVERQSAPPPRPLATPPPEPKPSPTERDRRYPPPSGGKYVVHRGARVTGRGGALLDRRSVDPDFVYELVRVDRPYEHEFVRVQAIGDETEVRLEEARERFKSLRIQYNQPKTLRYNRSNLLVMSIASANAAEARARVAEGRGEVKTAVAPLAEEVRAVLDGPPDQVKIALADAGEEEQKSVVRSVNSLANPTWTWHVTPLTMDDIELTLLVYNRISIGQKTVELERPVFSKTFVVSATLGDRLSWFFRGSAALIAIAAAFASITTAGIEYFRWRRERRKESEAVPPAPKTRRRKAAA